MDDRQKPPTTTTTKDGSTMSQTPAESPDTAENEHEPIELSRCDIAFLVNVRNVATLDEAIDIAALSLGRYGMDGFHVLATDPDTQRQWVIFDGNIQEADEATANLQGQAVESSQGD